MPDLGRDPGVKKIWKINMGKINVGLRKNPSDQKLKKIKEIQKIKNKIKKIKKNQKN